MKMKIEFLEEKIKWQEKMIGELENERDFLREQILGKAKGQDVGQYNYVSCCVQYLLHTSKLWAFLFISPYGC